jgi:hypothetical protein
VISWANLTLFDCAFFYFTFTEIHASVHAVLLTGLKAVQRNSTLSRCVVVDIWPWSPDQPLRSDYGATTECLRDGLCTAI